MALIIKLLLSTAICGICALSWVLLEQQIIAVTAIKDAGNKRAAYDAAMADAVKVQKSLEEDKAAFVDAGHNLDTTTQKNAAAKALLSTTKDQIAGLQKDWDAKDAEFTDTKSRYDALMSQMGSDTPDELRMKASMLAKSLAQDTVEKKIILDKLEGAKSSMSKLQTLVTNLDKNDYGMPPLYGTVKFVDHTWNFVVINVGTTQGVSPRGELSIYRGSTYLGKLKVSSVDTESCIADIEPDVKSAIQVGDTVASQ